MFCATQVLKVAILAEKYAIDYTWYVDVILNLIRIAGDYVSEEVRVPTMIYLLAFIMWVQIMSVTFILLNCNVT